MTEPTTITFRSQLVGQLQDFLQQVKISCVDTTDALAEIIVELSHYEEEGRRLFPSILISDDLSTTLRLTQSTDPLEIGSGAKGAETARLALKRCAPLTHGKWVMYIRRLGATYDYGVFRPSSAPTAIDMRETVRTLPADITNTVLLRQIAERTVEVVAPGERRLIVALSAARPSDPSPEAAVRRLVEAATAGLSPEFVEQTRTYLLSNLSRALVQGHGALIAVVPHASDPRVVLTDDGRYLATPLDIAGAVRDYVSRADAQAMATLVDFGTLLEGMLNTDGITVLDSHCRVLGYNAFVKSSGSESSMTAAFGGARRRAFDSMAERVLKGDMPFAFMRSASGRAEYRG